MACPNKTKKMETSIITHFYFRAEEIVKFRRVVGSDWLEYIYNV